jgi:predicted GIY-YIG superfamily endonuclease
MVKPEDLRWSVYLIETASNTLYCGIAIDVHARFQQHMNGKGAKYLKAHQPVAIVWEEHGHSHSSALKRERAVKSLSRADKLKLITHDKNT